MADLFSWIGDALGMNKGKATQDAAKKNAGIIDNLEQLGTGYLTDAKNTATDFLNYARPGADLYADSLGINGAEGNARATDAFHTAPGYDFALNQGLDALERRGSALGRLQSGNTDTDLLNYAIGTADQAYGNWQNDLGGFTGLYGQGVTGQENALGNLTDFAGNIASGRTGVNNENAAGAEANQGWGLDLLNSVGQLVSGFGGYGGFGGGGANAVGTGIGPNYTPKTGGLKLGYQF